MAASAKRPVTAPTTARAPQHWTARAQAQAQAPFEIPLNCFLSSPPSSIPLPPLFSLFLSSLPDILRPPRREHRFVRPITAHFFRASPHFRSIHRRAPLQHFRFAIVFVSSSFRCPFCPACLDCHSSASSSPTYQIRSLSLHRSAVPNSPLQVSWTLGFPSRLPGGCLCFLPCFALISPPLHIRPRWSCPSPILV